jgi:Domain of unknown function (DUF4167)
MSSDQRPRGRFNGKRPFQQQQRAPHRNQSLDSNGPNLKIRGSAYQIFERYIDLGMFAVAERRPPVQFNNRFLTLSS